MVDQIKIRIDAETRQAQQNLRDLERKVKALQDLADTGEYKGGFLTPKQVEKYRKITDEIERIHKRQVQRMIQLDEEYARKHQAIEEKLRQRQERYDRSRASGNGPRVQQHYENRVKQAQAELDTLEQQRRRIEDVRRRAGQVDSARTSSYGPSGQIGNMYQRNPNAGNVIGAGLNVLGSVGVITSISQLMSYLNQGMDRLRSNRVLSMGIGQKMGTYGGDDEGLRISAKDIGLKYGYGNQDSLLLQQEIIRGGTRGDIGAVSRDTGTYQEFGRAYAVDPNLMASSGNVLKKLGAMDEGQAKWFANLLATSIKKGGMGGREEEMIRATAKLAGTVGNIYQQGDAGKGRMEGIMGLQNILALTPGMKGEQGANIIERMDSSIKGENPFLDILLGKGSEFAGSPEAMWQFQGIKAQGASPDNIQRILTNSARLVGYGSGRTPLIKQGLMQLGLTQPEVEAMFQNGTISPDFQLNKEAYNKSMSAGQQDLQDKLSQANNTRSMEFLRNKAAQEATQQTTAVPVESVATDVMTMWNQLPESTRAGMVGIGGSVLGTLGTAASGFGMYGAGRTTRNAISTWMAQRAGKIGAGKVGAGLLRGMGASIIGAGGRIAGAGAKRIPIIGGLATVGIDQLANPENTWGHSLAKGAGGAIGSALGLLATGALGFTTGGVGLLAGGALTVGGGLAGEQAGDWLYNKFTGGKKAVPSTVNSPEDKYNGFVAKKDSQEVTITIQGSVNGMNEQNQSQISTAVSDYYAWLTKKELPYYARNSMDLSRDQKLR